MSEVVYRHDRDGDLVERVYKRAERRQYDANHEQGRQRLRDRIGAIERPPRTLRETCLGVGEPEPEQPDFIDALRARRKERERRERLRHS